MGGRDERLAEIPAREGRARLVEHLREVVQPTLADERQRGAPLRVIDVVEHAELVVLPKRRGPPAPLGIYSEDHGWRKSAKRVSPPSTNSVWPVT